MNIKNTMKSLFALFALIVVTPLLHAQQNTLTMTTLSQSQTDSSNVIILASQTNVTAGVNASSQTILFIDGEQENVLNITGTAITVSRGQNGTKGVAHSSGQMVLLGRPNWFYSFNPSGACVTANVYATPWVNIKTNQQWLCSSVTKNWVPGWGNHAGDIGVTTLVASTAGTVTPSGPLFHINGTSAITGFTQPIGCDATAVGTCQFTVIPDAAFTWTAAGNIAVLGTAVANLAIQFTWDATNSKWVQIQSK